MSGIVIRCDGSGSLGLGHVSRCLSLARALRSLGVPVLFAMRPLEEAVLTRVADAGFPVSRLPLPAGESDVLGADDLGALLETATGAGASTVLVDHYGASAEYLGILRSRGLGLAVIDDVGDRDLSAADWILNQNLGAEALSVRHRPGAALLLGPRYALLRPEFARIRAEQRRSFYADDRRVLLTLGGGDARAALRALLESLEDFSRALELRLLGRTLPSLTGLASHRVEALQDPPDVAASMAWADLSVNAAGSTCWELACLGIPMLLAVLSPDQEAIAAALVRYGAAVAFSARDPSDLPARVEDLLGRPERRRVLSEVGRGLVDGRGAERAADMLTELIVRRGGKK